MSLDSLLTEEQAGVLRFGGSRMALLDVEAGFWGLRRQMEALVGRQLTDNALQQAGANGGASFARAYATDFTEESALSAFCECVAAYQAAGFGKFEVEILEWPLGRVQVYGRDTFEAWMMRQHDQPTDHPACAYTSGVLVGFINALTSRRDIVCIQHTCQAQGAKFCSFELLPASEAERTAVVAFDPDPGFTGQASQTTLIQQSEVEMNELSTLLAISRNLASTLELESSLGLILDQFRAIVAYDGAAIMALEEDALKVLAYRGPIAQEDALQLRFPLAEAGANQVVIQRREPVIIPDVRGDSALARAFQETADQQLDTNFGYVRSWMGVPLINRDEVIGMLTLDHRQPDAYTGRHSLLALTVANKVAVAIENTRLYQEEQERRQELQTLLNVVEAASSSLDLDEMLKTTLDLLVDLVGASRAGVMLLNEASGQLELRMLRPERAILPKDLEELTRTCQKIMASGEPLYAEPGMEKGFLEPGAFFSLRSREEVLGVIGIIGVEGSRFSQGQLTLFNSIADQLAVALENARLYERAEEAAVAAERTRLARDLHDAVSQTLFSASLIAEVLPRLWESNPEEGRRRLEELRELTRGALAEMRALLMELRPATLMEFSLADLLRQLAEATIGRSRLPVDLVVEGERSLPPDVKVTFYRIAQEALHNVDKHAGADTVMMRLYYGPESVRLTIQDNGRGFDTHDIPPNSLGVGIMRERADKIGATFNLNSQIGEGTTVTVRWPFEETKDE
ncbi:MAG: GAF domain-containing protein [Chloroflexota bacterium]|jgi:two-component system nitrate/nitrite sensor histidine kinase NarX